MSKTAFVGRDYTKINHGYEYLYVWKPDHPNATKSGHIAKHRLVASEMLGRALFPGEVVHHRNGVTTDNRPENLQAMPLGEHTKIHKPQRRVTVACAKCGVSVVRKYSDTVRRNPKAFYCSRKCFGVSGDTRQTLTCRACGKQFVLSSAHAKRSKGFCSHRCDLTTRRLRKVA